MAAAATAFSRLWWFRDVRDLTLCAKGERGLTANAAKMDMAGPVRAAGTRDRGSCDGFYVLGRR